MYFQVSGCTPSRHHFDYHASPEDWLFYAQIRGIFYSKVLFQRFSQTSTQPHERKLKKCKIVKKS